MFRLARFIVAGVFKVLLIIWVGVFLLDHGDKIPVAAAAFAKSAGDSIPEDTTETMRDVTRRTLSIARSGVSEILEIYKNAESTPQQ